ncbi:Uu.00g062580.m01.CDS01 [Anthostomella pinea]|uniref:Uu.00g062580.m01.CDS01 n=1 Tax=Anthostomella pinea TaxID=933095 RepID=A0AAI8VUF5_9PEZI|nr:Uu.00g062580.m01.CDS01 [Anthostomella pinea]
MPPLRALAAPRCLRTLTSPPTSTIFNNLTPARTRTLTTTAPLPRQTPSHLTVPLEQVPDYPFGRFTTYKQRNEGLFGRTKIRFGNVVASKYGNKSRTSWLPNRQTKRLWSPALQGFVRTRMTASVLKTIDKLGGIDEYLLGGKTKRIRELGPAGWRLRWKIMQTPAVQERFARERAAMGLPPKGDGEAVTMPVGLLAEGETAEEAMSEIDGMLERGDEFVIGEVKEGEDMVAHEDREAIEEARQATEDVDYVERKTL